MILKIAARNVFRHRRRSFLSALSVFFAAVVVTLSEGWVSGMLDAYARNYADYQTGDLRVVSAEYAKRERFVPVDETVPAADTLAARLAAVPGVVSVEERIRFGILLGHGEKTVPAFGFGIDLDASRFRIPEKIAGESRPAGALAPGIYLGRTLFTRLGLAEGDELLLVTRTSEGGLNGIKLPVRAAVSFGVSLIDEKCFFIPAADARRLLRLHDASLGLYVFGNGDPAALAAAVAPHLPDGVIAQTRRDQAPAIDDMFTMSKNLMWFVEAFILFLASFVVINTMLMAVYERMREIGALKALGMRDGEVFRQFTLEGALIGAAGGLAGVLVGGIVLLALSGTGINLADAFSNVDMPIEYIVRPSASPAVFAITILLSILVPAVAAAIPARRARKLAPAEALRRV